MIVLLQLYGKFYFLFYYLRFHFLGSTFFLQPFYGALWLLSFAQGNFHTALGFKARLYFGQIGQNVHEFMLCQACWEI